MPLSLLNNLLQRKPPSVPKYTVDGDIAFTIGNFTFHGTEIPERLEYIGGDQMLAVHTFPGGIRTVQALGYFPAALSWSGWLFSIVSKSTTTAPVAALKGNIFGDTLTQTSTTVATALERMDALKNICNAGLPLYMNYGGISLQCVVNQFHAEIHNQNQVRYTISLVVVQDNSAISSNQQTLNQRQVLQQWANKLSDTVGQAGLPFDLSNPLQALQDGLQSLLLRYDSAAAADITNLINLASSVSSVAGNYISGSGAPEIQSLALDSASIASGVTNAANGVSASTTSVTSINPSLPTLASQFYGDASQWTTIASANGLLDPQPIGQFVNLTIPPVGPNGPGGH